MPLSLPRRSLPRLGLRGLAPHHRRTLVKLLVLGVLATAFAAQAVGALLPHVPLLLAATAGSLAAEGVLYRWQRGMVSLFAKSHADVTVRHVLRDLLLVVGLLRLGEQHRETVYAPLVAGLLAFYGLHWAIQAVSVLVRRTRTPPVVTRNIDTRALRLTPAPPLLLRRPGPRLAAFGLPATAGLLATTATDAPVYGAAGLALSLTVALAGLGALLLRLLPGRRPAGEQEVLDWFEAWLAEYRPTVGLYFSGGASSAYQANMWLEPLARLDGRPLIVLRERHMVQRIAATDIPVVCLPRVSTLMRLEHSTLRVLLHPSNSGKTSQVLRIPTIKHAFVNHGESDKLSSCNPYAKAYDEVWVAGPAARERYALAEVGVEDKDVVEIGRPQLDAVAPYAGPPAPGAYTTVLYAPTWEGWDGNPGNTSVVEAGEPLVRALLADPGVRLLYKPHPLTGSVDPRARAADLRIRELVRAANRERGGPRPDASAAAELTRRTAELDGLVAAGFRSAADQAERMLRRPAPEPGRAGAVARATAAWEEAYWASLPAWEHQVVTDARPPLYACFNQADLLVSDVSSVISDFLASGKPYAVANTSGLAEDVFRKSLPTVAAATVLAPDASGVPALLDAVRHPELDELAEARVALALRLLGPAEPPSQERFAGAVRALCATAGEHRARRAERTTAELPLPAPRRHAGPLSAAAPERRSRP
ncbi:putative integral membrane protein [Streptomyces ambofaciens ATCC 23877]|uniref:Putative integral membrane protein n=1 Tax=Streptomyces ambofaciens (strain ATCC 23877 / 3486 / DSM 40053 / JCM 4204 / NBRC 12836 / NRRL B-2516) TaxID=278992 RepID=A0A0K2AS94_STRA7|nr:putative integral membrane protein [Streptomyces ambofaciens ATCC 23877]